MPALNLDGDVNKCAIEREGEEVVLRFNCADHYAAILLYDKLTAEAQKGGVSVSFTTRLALQTQD